MGENSGLGLRFGTGTSQAIIDAANASSVAAVTEPETIEPDEYQEEATWEEEEEELPIISIELERLVGYKPSTVEEIESIKKQLIDAMWMRYKSSSSSEASEEAKDQQRDNTEEEHSEEEPPPDFDDQIQELLNSRVARFGYVECIDVEGAGDPKKSDGTADETTSSPDESPSSFPFLDISYPSRVIQPNASSEHDIQDTYRIWRDIRSLSYALDDEINANHEDHFPDETNDTQREETRESDVSFWYHLAEHLEHTGRKLLWKHAMALELKDILYRETLHKKHELWVKEQRTAKLEQLYQVRETLVHRKEVAQQDFDRLAIIKDNAIRRDMLLYDHNEKRKQRQHGSSLLGGGELSFPEEFELMGLLPKESVLYEEEDWGGTLDDEDDYDYYNSDYSDYSDEESDLSGFSGDEEGDDDNERPDPQPPLTSIGKANAQDDPSNLSNATDTLEIGNKVMGGIGTAAPNPIGTTSVPKPFLRRNRKRRQKKARAQKKRELAEAQRKVAQQKRKEHEAFLEARHRTNELVLAQTLLEALEKKVGDVEELLENLQDEEWAAVEEAEAKKASALDTNDDEKVLSLLDQILAMILGALPMEPGSKDQERHFQYVKDEHDFIVHGWKNYFGRLPPAFVPGASQAHASALQNEGDPMESPRTTANVDRKPKHARGFAAPPTVTAAAKLSKIVSRKTTAAVATNITTATPQEQRMALGIFDNADADWDDVADGDDDDE